MWSTELASVRLDYTKNEDIKINSYVRPHQRQEKTNKSCLILTSHIPQLIANSVLLLLQLSSCPATMSSSSSKHRTIDTIHQSIRQWSYLLAEAIPSRRQTLNLPLVQPPQISSRTASSSRSIGSAPHRTATASLDADTTRKLRAECAARGLPLDSALVASLFLAAAEAVRVERAPRISARGHTLSARITRFAVLGLVCVVMAVLSGSVESKLMRYFCSFYAVIAGGSIWVGIEGEVNKGKGMAWVPNYFGCCLAPRIAKCLSMLMLHLFK